MGHGDNLFDQLRLADQRRQLGGDSHQHARLVGGKGPRLARLHDEHALENAPLDQRHAQERVVGIFACFREKLEARVGKSVAHHQRSHFLRDQAGQPFVEPHAHVADALRLQADGGAEDKRAPFGPEHIHGANIRVKASLNEPDNIAERLARVVAMRDELADLLERQEQRTFMDERGSSHCLPQHADQ